MPGIILSVTIFWGLLLVVLGVIAMVATLGTDDSDSLFYTAVGIVLSGGFLTVNGVIIAILDAIFKSSMGGGINDHHPARSNHIWRGDHRNSKKPI